MGAVRALVTGLLVLICACGPMSRPALATKPNKGPSPTAVATPSSPPWVAPFEAIDFIDRSNGWAVIESDADKAVEVIRTEDGGATWSAPVKVTSLNVPEGDNIPPFRVRFTSPQVGWVFGTGVFGTTDGGVSWKASNVPNLTFDIAAVGPSVWAMAGCDDRNGSACPGTILQWDDTRGAWSALPHQPVLASGPFQLIRVSTSVAYVAQQSEMDTRLVRTTNGGATWTPLETPCRGFGMPVATLDGVRLWMICPSQPSAGTQAKWTYTSDDAGAHWTLRSYSDGTSNLGSIPLSGCAQWLVITTTSTGFLANDRGDLYRSTDHGRTWMALDISRGEGFFPALQFVDVATGWAVAQVPGVTPDYRVGLFRTTDGGATWRVVSSMPGSVL